MTVRLPWPPIGQRKHRDLSRCISWNKEHIVHNSVDGDRHQAVIDFVRTIDKFVSTDGSSERERVTTYLAPESLPRFMDSLHVSGDPIIGQKTVRESESPTRVMYSTQ